MKEGSSALRKYAICVSDEAGNPTEFPLVGQRGYLDSVMASIDKGNSVLLIGPPGVGKRSLAIGISRILYEREHDRRIVYRVPLGTKFWVEANEGDAKEANRRLLAVLESARALGPSKLVLFIDDIDVLSVLNRGDCSVGVSASSSSKQTSSTSFEESSSCENLLKSLLLDRLLVCVCTCEEGAYNQFLKADSFYDDKFTANFRVLWVREPDVTQAKQMLGAHKRRLERKYSVKIEEDALSIATSLASQYISHRCLPEKAVEVMEEVCYRAKSKMVRSRHGKSSSSSSRSSEHGKQVATKRVMPRDIQLLVSEWCKLPYEKLKGPAST